MNNCGCNNHTNAFIDLNGIPYVLGEYVDRTQFMQVDRSLIKSNIFIDQTESMRAVIDISIDDIGKVASDGSINAIGNTTKQKNLLKMIRNNASMLDNQLDVIRGGIVLRINYQLENYSTNQVIRSMTEDLRIPERVYALNINSKDVDDNSIIVNFNRAMVSTINEFTHGNDRMVLRITNVQMMYECVKRSIKLPRIKDSIVGNESYNPLNGSIYDYHKNNQSQHFLGDPRCTSGNGYCDKPTLPAWSVFNRYYHFSEDASDLILHNEEIYDPMNEVVLIPCGNVRINRSFIINPGHRLIFKFSIWKNDVTLVNDTTNVAKALDVPVLGDVSNNCGCNCNDTNNNQMILMMIDNMKNMINQQNTVINQLVATVNNINHKNDCGCHHNHHPVPPPPSSDDCNCDEEHEEINNKLNELENEINDVKDNIGSGECNCDPLEPMSPETITELLKDL